MANLLDLPLEVRLMIYEYAVAGGSGVITPSPRQKRNFSWLRETCDLPCRGLLHSSKQINEEVYMALMNCKTGGIEIGVLERGRWRRSYSTFKRDESFRIPSECKLALSRLRKFEVWILNKREYFDWNDHRPASLGNCIRRLIEILRRNPFANTTCKMEMAITFDSRPHPGRVDYVDDYEDVDEEGYFSSKRVLRSTEEIPTDFSKMLMKNEHSHRAASRDDLVVWFRFMQLREFMRRARAEMSKYVSNMTIRSNVEDLSLPTGLTCHWITPEKMAFHDEKNASEVGIVQLEVRRRKLVQGLDLPEGSWPTISWEQFTEDWEAEALEEREEYYEALESAKTTEAARQGVKRKAAQAKSREKKRAKTTD